MNVLEELWSWAPFLIALLLLLAMHRLTWWLLLRHKTLTPERRLPRQLLTVVIVVVGLVVLVVLMPVTDDGLIRDSTKGDLLGLLGLAITAILTLSSTTLAANAMAGLMLRMEHSYRPGDFVRVGEQFGRITERGLFHTEIQTEDRDLVTLPNLYLATNPIRVVRSSGTIISTEVSLGYDVSHARAEELLVRAATKVELADAYVWIIDLKDHAVVYRVCGFLEDVKTLVSARSKLRASVLDTLHEAGVEIVSPSYMAQRPAPKEERVIPSPSRPKREPDASSPEEIVFDKAEAAEHLEALTEERSTLEAERKELERKHHEATDDTQKAAREAERARLEARLAEIEALMDEFSRPEGERAK